MLQERPMVRTDSELAALCAELREAGRFAIDTEFIGERSYVPRFCLAMVATPAFITLIDPLPIRNLDPLWGLLADAAVEKVLHAAREDLRLAYYGGKGAVPARIWDTQVAAGLIGFSPYPPGYGRLVQSMLGVRLDKSETRSDWDRRPLSPEQIRYARDDVRYLLPLADRLRALLEEEGRVDWAEEEMGKFTEASLYEPDPEEAYLRVRSPRRGMNGQATAVLQALAAWRERTAADQDVPVRSILSDDLLTALSLRPPRRVHDLSRVRGFPEGDENTLGPPIMKAITAAQAVAEADLPPALAEGPDERTPEERAIADMIYSLATALCASQKISPELALGRAEAAALARGDRNLPVLKGWRRTALGENLCRFVEGAATAQVRVEGKSVGVSFGEVSMCDAPHSE
ncbi:MAG: HRDC domain-containing protein [Armatimonadota bacterium]|nr:HRDC domain-containing protein [Armatimonadota bacterium]